MPTATADQTDVLSTLVSQRDDLYKSLERLYEDAAEKEAEAAEKEEMDDDEHASMTDEEKQAQADKEEEDEKEMQAEEKKLQARIERLDSKIKRYQSHAASREKHNAVMAEIAASNPAATPGQRKQAGKPTVKVKTPETYNEGREYSVFLDMASEFWGDHGARERLYHWRAHHGARQRRDGVAELQPDGTWATNTTETGGGATASAAGGGMAAFVPPTWLLDRWADRLTPGAPTLNNLERLSLPADGMSIVVPKVTAPVRTTGRGSATDPTAAQAGEAAPVRSVKVAGGLISAHVETVAGEIRITRQMVDRGYFADEVAYKTLRDDLETKKNQLLLDGQGHGHNEPVGLLEQASAATTDPLISRDKAKASALTFPEAWGEMTALEGAMHARRFVAPDRLVCDPLRWAATKGYLDGDDRPMIGNSQMISTAVNVPGVDSSNVRGLGLKGEFNAIPVIVDPSLPLQGGSSDQHGWLAMNTEDILWFESGVQSIAVNETHASSLEVAVVIYAYVALIGNYREGSLGLLKGTGWKL